MDIRAIAKLKQAWAGFCAEHPRFPGFLRAVAERGAVPGAEVKISVTYPDGETLNAGLRIRESDKELIDGVRELWH